MEKNKKVLQSPLNYTGGKHKLIPQILPLFPSNSSRLVDLFSGGGSITVNAIQQELFPKYLMNDKEKRVIDFYNYLENQNIEEFITQLENKISEYGLSNTKKNGYAYYLANSNDGLSKYNKEKFNQLRKEYNNQPTNILFYMLIIFGFNNQIRFNKKDEFNISVGKRDFNTRMEQRLRNFWEQLQQEKIDYCSKDFRDILLKENDFIYADPPYLITTASYNENGGWTEKDEVDLYNYLDSASKQGIKFALSNVMIHKGIENKLLKEWAKQYVGYNFDHNYNYSNYQSKAKDNVTKEVLITNYL